MQYDAQTLYLHFGFSMAYLAEQLVSETKISVASELQCDAY